MPYVLIAEDDRDCADMLAFWLRCEGFEVGVTANGREALESLRARRPCAVLLDLMMPVMDGIEFRRAQLREPAIADIPVLCVSASVDAMPIAAELNLSCVSKPVSLDDLTERVQRMCQPTDFILVKDDTATPRGGRGSRG